jgi:hypothetical protein
MTFHASMWPPVLFRERSVPVKFAIAVALPILFGALCGFLLGESKLWFMVVSTAGVVAGVTGRLL